MPPTAGRLCVKLHSATVEHQKRYQSDNINLYVVVEIEEYGRLQSRPSSEPEWNQELTIEVGPKASTVKLCLYAESAADDDELIGQGSYCLDSLFQNDEPGILQNVRVPLVRPQDFKATGEVRLSLKFFYGRTPGKFRDLLGKEYINDIILSGGPTEGVKKVITKGNSTPGLGVGWFWVEKRVQVGQDGASVEFDVQNYYFRRLHVRLLFVNGS